MSAPEHRCALGEDCAAREIDPATGEPGLPAAIERQHGLCRVCGPKTRRAVEGLPALRDALRSGLGEFQRPDVDRKIQFGPRVPVNLARLDLAEEIAGRLMAAAGELGVADPWGIEIADCAEHVAEHLDELVEAECGPVLARKLAQSSRNAVAALGLARGRAPMPVPCFHCSSPRLGRWHGAGEVDCLDCHAAWPEAQYKRLCFILVSEHNLGEEAA